MTRTRTDCAAPITPHSKTGRCRTCALRASLRSPDVEARRAAGVRAIRSDPEYVERHRQGCVAGTARAMQCPAERERRRQQGLTTGIQNLHHRAGSEVIARRNETIRAKHLSWCPREFWGLNERLKRKGFKLPERKAIILAEIPGTAEHARREVANHALRMRLKHEREVRDAY